MVYLLYTKRQMVNYQSLVGREWEYGKHDCFSLIRDYYKLLGVFLPDYERPNDLTSCNSIFLDQAIFYGFQEIEFKKRRLHDVLIMRIGTQTPMHAAIYLENERILHQKQDSLSCTESLGSYYVKQTKGVFRYAAGHFT